MPINYKLLKRIQKSIAKEPRRLEMEFGIKVGDKIAPCGTTACIAGHAVIHSFKSYRSDRFGKIGYKIANANPSHIFYEEQVSWGYIRGKAIKALGITSPQAERLFHVDYWPNEFKDAYFNTDSRRKRAAIAVDRIGRFMDTKGQE